MDQVATWCKVQSGGRCIWDYSISGLAEQWDVEYLEGDWNAIEESLEQNDEPVIVTIANPHLTVDRVGDHAVVVWKIERGENGLEYVVYMDPLTADHERKLLADFIRWWDNPGARAFVLRP